MEAPRRSREAPALSEARVVLVWAKLADDRDLSGAEKELRAVIELDPNYPRARQNLAEILTKTSRFAEAAAETKRALELRHPLTVPFGPACLCHAGPAGLVTCGPETLW
jgi:Tfp pilus assembly protein PilF